MTYEPITIIYKPDGSAELAGGWPLHTVIWQPPEDQQQHGVTVTPEAENPSRMRIKVGDQEATYEQVGVTLGGGLACDWVPRG